MFSLLPKTLLVICMLAQMLSTPLSSAYVKDGAVLAWSLLLAHWCLPPFYWRTPIRLLARRQSCEPTSLNSILHPTGFCAGACDMESTVSHTCMCDTCWHPNVSRKLAGDVECLRVGYKGLTILLYAKNTRDSKCVLWGVPGDSHPSPDCCVG